MPYTPTTWVNDSTPLDATNMNHLELGLQAAAASAEQAPRADAITSITAWDVPVWNGSSWVRPSGTASVATFLRGDGAWALPVSAATALPGSPVDGQETILVDSLTNPTYRWRFRYNAGSASVYKWEFIGGTPITIEATSGSTAGNTPGAVGATLTLPVAGDWEFHYGGQLGQSADFNNASAKIGTGSVFCAHILTQERTNTNTNSKIPAAGWGTLTGLAASAAIRFYLFNSNGVSTVSISQAWIRATPVRVS